MITSTANDTVKAARKLARREGRRGSSAFLVEGPQVVREAVPWLRQLFVTHDARDRHADLVTAAAAVAVEVVLVSDAVLRSISDTTAPQGVVGVAELPRPALTPVLRQARLVLGLYEVADPGNAGTVLRTADAMGADAVVLTRGSVDVRNPKAVRASAGSLFHLPVVADQPAEEVLERARRASLQVVGAAADGAVQSTHVDLTRPSLLLLGNEAHGLPAPLLQRCDVTVRVPLHTAARPGYGGHAESLNLAATAAMLGYEAARQRRAGGVT